MKTRSDIRGELSQSIKEIEEMQNNPDKEVSDGAFEHLESLHKQGLIEFQEGELVPTPSWIESELLRNHDNELKSAIKSYYYRTIPWNDFATDSQKKEGIRMLMACYERVSDSIDKGKFVEDCEDRTETNLTFVLLSSVLKELKPSLNNHTAKDIEGMSDTFFLVLDTLEETLGRERFPEDYKLDLITEACYAVIKEGQLPKKLQ